METQTLTDDAVTSIRAEMLGVAGLSVAVGGGPDSPAVAGAGEIGAGICLQGWRGGTRDMPAARLGLSWEEMLAEGWDVDEVHSEPLRICDRHQERDARGDQGTGDYDRVAHGSPALRLLAMLSAAFTN